MIEQLLPLPVYTTDAMGRQRAILPRLPAVGHYEPRRFARIRRRMVRVSDHEHALPL